MKHLGKKFGMEWNGIRLHFQFRPFVLSRAFYLYFVYITRNGNRTEWSPIIRAVIIRVITAHRESDLFITSMITDSLTANQSKKKIQFPRKKE